MARGRPQRCAKRPTSRTQSRQVQPGRGANDRRGAKSGNVNHGIAAAWIKPPTGRPTKDYVGARDPRKDEINTHFARTVKSHVGTECVSVILDTARCVTSRRLVAEGFSARNIYAPNINRADCHALEEYGVNAPYMSIEELLCGWGENAASAGRRVDTNAASADTHAQCAGNRIVPRALWYDSQTDISGSALHGHYIGPVVDKFLLMNRGRECVIAVSMAQRCNQREAVPAVDGVKNTVAAMVEQIRRLISKRGFKPVGEYVQAYRGMVYSVWCLCTRRGARVAGQDTLLMWEDRDQIVTFPPGYCVY